MAGSVDLPAVTLATCNRLEIYAETATEDPAEIDAARTRLLDAVARESELTHDVIASSFRTLSEDEAVTHLFEVGAGLDSAVVGEREIAGQVRRSLTEAQSAGTASGTLTKLFESATRTAKEVGTRTALGSRGRSIVSVALDVAGDMHPDPAAFYRDASVVLVGTGAYAGTSLVQLHERGVRDIGVFSGSGRAEQFVAERGGAAALRMEDLSEAFARADVVIGCSGGSRRISAREMSTLTGIRPGQDPTRELTVIDLALSHDFTPDVADLPGVELITLESVKVAAPDEAQASLEQAREVVRAAVGEYQAERAARSADDAIVALRRHTLSLLDDEMERIRAQHGCTAASQEVEFAVRRLVRKLLHTPTVRARELAADGRGQDYVRALEDVFGLEVTPREKPERSAPAKRRRLEEFDAAELAQMAAYLQQVPDGGFCRHHSTGEFRVERLDVARGLGRRAS